MSGMQRPSRIGDSEKIMHRMRGAAALKQTGPEPGQKDGAIARMADNGAIHCLQRFSIERSGDDVTSVLKPAANVLLSN